MEIFLGADKNRAVENKKEFFHILFLVCRLVVA